MEQQLPIAPKQRRTKQVTNTLLFVLLVVLMLIS